MALSSFLPATPSPASTSSYLQGHGHSSRHGHGHGHGHGQGSHHKQKQQQLLQRKKKKQLPSAPHKTPSSWEQLKSLLTCRIVGLSQVHDPSSVAAAGGGGAPPKYTKLGSSCTYICALKDVVHGSTRVVHHRGEHDHSPDSCSSGSGPLGPETSLLAARSSSSRPASRSGGAGGYSTAAATSCSSSRGGLQLRKLSGCYECHAISEPRRYPTPRTISSCTECGEVFTKAESLELHQAIRHAVSELGPEDSGRNIVEIIFKSSWLKKDHPVCKIERILKVHNTQRTIARFEDYREAVKGRAAPALLQLGGGGSSSNARQQLGGVAAAAAAGKKNPRCAADGNELLRFHCTTLTCSLGARGSTSLCAGASSSAPSPCGVCTVIRHGFARAHQEPGRGVRTTASSGRAHDCCCCPPGGDLADGGMGRRAMLVCRVIAGRVRRPGDDVAGSSPSPDEGGVSSPAGFDSVAAAGGAYTNLEELFVSNPRAILPCFVVIYRAL